MTSQRWQDLMADDNAELTDNEIEDGWHFCHDWDGLLVGPEMKEAESCQCKVGV